MEKEQPKTIYEAFELDPFFLEDGVDLDTAKETYFRTVLTNYTTDKEIGNKAFNLFKEIKLIDVKPNTLYNVKIEYLAESAAHAVAIITLGKINGFSVIGFYHNSEYHFVYLDDAVKYGNLVYDIENLACVTNTEECSPLNTTFSTEFKDLNDFIELMKLINPTLEPSINLKL